MPPLFFDLGSTSVLKLNGAESLDLLHRITTNDVARLAPGEARETLFVTEKGRLIDRVAVLARGSGADLLPSGGAASTLKEWIEKFIIMEDVSLELAPGIAHRAVISIPAESAPPVPAWLPAAGRWTERPAEGILLAVRTLHAGCDRTDLLLEGEAPTGITSDGRAAGAEEWERFRIRSGIPAHGKEITDAFNPYETNLAGAISFTKGCYIGQEVIARLDTYDKVQRELVLVGLPDGIPAAGLPVRLEWGWLTSCAAGEPGSDPVGLAVLRRGAAEQGGELLDPGTGIRLRPLRRFPAH